jgi:hypothetical protein
MLCSNRVLDPEGEVDPVGSNSYYREDWSAFVETSLPRGKEIDVICFMHSFDQA